MNYIKHIIVISISFLSVLKLYASTETEKRASYINIPQKAYAWCDSVYNTMSLQERIGQLFIASALTTEDAGNKALIAKIGRAHV